MLSSNLLLNAFDNTASSYNNAAYLPRLISQRLISRLEDLHGFEPQDILDLGCGTGLCLQLLNPRYPNSHLTGIDWSLPLLTQAKKAIQINSSQIDFVQGDITKLPFSKNAFDLICANLSLLWIPDLLEYLRQLKQFLKTDGLLLFTLLGVDTFEPLREDTSSYPWGFSDIHTLGDILMNAQWQDVVIDVDRFITEHSNRVGCYKELKQLGLHTLFAEYEKLNGKKKNISQTAYQINWEVIYAQAWKLEPSRDVSQTQEISIPISQLSKDY